MSIKAQRVNQEYNEGQDFLRNRKQRWVRQLVLMNNLRRGDENLSTTLLFSYFNRTLSNLYDDRLQVKFLPSEDSDYRRTEALSKLQTHDYREMEKATLDYEWLWDTCFFGRGYVETLAWNTERMMMMPKTINPLVMVYDPYFSDVQKWRYYGKWVLKASYEIQKLIKDGVITGIKNVTELPSGVETELWDYKTRIDQAKEGIGVSSESLSTEGIYQILEFYTHNDEGEKCIVWTDKNISKILFEKKLDLKDGEGGESKWPLVTKECFKISHSSLPISVPDIIEDKHRALNVLYNLMYISAKDEANPIYAYDVDQVQDVVQLFQRQVNQHIPIKGNPATAIQPLRTTSALTASLAQYINLLKNESAESVGTANISSPVQRGKKTATESALMQQIADLAGSLQGKLLAQGERDFWSHWYQRYVRHAKEGDKKLITMESVSGITFESIELYDLKTKYPPRVLVLSSKDAEYKELVARRDFMQLFPMFSKAMDQGGMKNFMKHVFFPKFNLDTSTIELMLPKSQEEIHAEVENEALNAEHTAMVRETDDDEVHLYVHARAKNTPETWAHRAAHESQLAKKKEAAMKRAETAATAQAAEGEMPGLTDVGNGTNAEGAVPLMGNMVQQNIANRGPIR